MGEFHTSSTLLVHALLSEVKRSAVGAQSDGVLLSDKHIHHQK
jgi:hypothetical protein